MITVKNLLLLPCQSGLLGFAIFFTVILLSKIISYLFGILPNFMIEMPDVYLSTIGFVLTFLISFLKHLNLKEKPSQLAKSDVNNQVKLLIDNSEKMKKRLTRIN